MPNPLSDHVRKGRGAVSNAVGRFEGYEKLAETYGWEPDEETPLATSLTADASRTIIARNDSPDIGFDQSINPYRGCEHGCIYCFARPTHAYLGLSPGLDFESRLFYKPRAAELLEIAFRKKDYKPSVIAMGSNTDPYQPVERDQRLTRQILQVMQRFAHPVTIVTKSWLVTRDIDILAEMASRNLARVAVSITTLDPALARTLEPRAPSPQRRLKTLRQLAEAGIPTIVMAAPMIPALNDHEMEGILDAAAGAGVRYAGTTLVRLPLEIKGLFEEWLEAHAPGRAKHVMSLIQQCHAGKLYRSDWGTRMTGQGPYADILRARFNKATARLRLNAVRRPLDLSQFTVPAAKGDQMSLFW